MGNALLSAVSGLRAHQTMLDVAGNNLGNVNTPGFKSSRVVFGELLSQTIRAASQPSTATGGTNPVQIGSGVQVGSVDRNMAQGSLIDTGQPLDMALEGAGFFTLNDGTKDVYTRVGAFAVDAEYYLVDPGTGNRVQRIGSEGVAEGFQDPASDNIRIPYDVTLPARASENLGYTGNLSANETGAVTNLLSSGLQYSSDSSPASGSTVISALDQASTDLAGTLRITGTNPDGTTMPTVDLTVTNGVTTLSNLLDAINNGVGVAEQYRGVADNAVATAGTNYVTAVGADSILTITYDGVTRTIGSDNEGSADVLTTGLDSGGTLTVSELAALVNTAFNGQTGTVSHTMGDIASAVDRGTNEWVLQIETAGETPNGAITDLSIAATTGDVEFLAGGPNDNVVTAEFQNSVNGSGTNGFYKATATIENSEIRVTDDVTGYSQTDMNIELLAGGTGTLELPSYFKLLAAGGGAVKNTNVEIFDSLGIGHTLSAAFVRTATANQWDLVLTALSGEVELTDRRVKGITFMTNGSYGGITGTDPTRFQVEFGHDPGNVRSIYLDFGTVGAYDGLSQVGGPSTVAPSTQDGYASGWLSSMAVMRDGALMGIFTNGVRRDIAALEVAIFQNPAGLESLGTNYFTTSANSGNAVATRALSGGAGAVRGGALEKSNVEVAAEFVNMIQAQNGFQANARTIRVANEMLRDLTNLIR